MTSRQLIAATLVLALVAVACSGDDDEATPEPAKLSGPPVVVGLINMEGGTVGSFPELRVGAEAAVRYVNDRLGGVEGRPLEIDACSTDGTPESSRRCAERLVARGPVAVLGGLDAGAASSLAVVEAAGIPYVTSSPLLGEELTSENAFAFTGGTAADLLGQAEYITGELEVENMGVVHVDLPGLVSTAVLAARTILRLNGVKDLKVVPEDSDAADFAPALSAAVEDDPEVVAAVFPAQGCARVMQAKVAIALSPDVKMFYPSACAAESVIAAGGPGAEDAYFASPFLPYADRSEGDVEIYRDELERTGGDDAEPSILSQTGFSAVVNLQRLLVDSEGVTTPALTAQLRAAKDRPSFMGHDFTCDGDQVPLLKAVCSSHVRILQYRAGDFHDVVGDWVSGAELVRQFTE